MYEMVAFMCKCSLNWPDTVIGVYVCVQRRQRYIADCHWANSASPHPAASQPQHHQHEVPLHRALHSLDSKPRLYNAYTMTATNRDGHKVYLDGNSNENVKN